MKFMVIQSALTGSYIPTTEYIGLSLVNIGTYSTMSYHDTFVDAVKQSNELRKDVAITQIKNAALMSRLSYISPSQLN